MVKGQQLRGGALPVGTLFRLRLAGRPACVQVFYHVLHHLPGIRGTAKVDVHTVQIIGDVNGTLGQDVAAVQPPDHLVHRYAGAQETALHSTLDGIVAAALGQQGAVGVDAPETRQVLRQHQDAVILRDEEQIAALIREIPGDLLRCDGLVMDGDTKLPSPLHDGILREVVLLVMVCIQRQHLMLLQQILKTRQKHITAEIDDLH